KHLAVYIEKNCIHPLFLMSFEKKMDPPDGGLRKILKNLIPACIFLNVTFLVCPKKQEKIWQI
ncbi:MAG: hypothetical protein MJ182_10850, partial [Treponema sp.]|nr:hypothetical protein [Treponema sp.]